MIWDDTGFLLSKNKYNENSIISEIYTKNHGKVSGIIFGGTSKKIKNYLQIGNEIHVNFNSKSDNKIGYFKVEILKALSPIYFENPQKLLSILSAMQLVKLLTADYQTNKDIYTLINKFYFLLNNKDWIKKYIFWELELFKLLGYDLELKDLVDKKLIGNEFKYVSKSSIEKKIIPNFLVDQNVTSVDVINLQKGLKFVGDYLEKTILKPNNLNQPSSRLEFISTVK
tara:strand:- start:973 stop:1653 length:681 start_codon:yes stop_codon:yes gene_type:complete